MSIWLVGDETKEVKDAFKKGNDFLAAGRLEPAFAEFRRCPPSETVATVMYKLSLAFEEQAKPERAEAVLEWMKRTHGTHEVTSTGKQDSSTGPQRLGRYVIERRIGRGAMRPSASACSRIRCQTARGGIVSGSAFSSRLNTSCSSAVSPQIISLSFLSFDIFNNS